MLLMPSQRLTLIDELLRAVPAQDLRSARAKPRT